MRIVSQQGTLRARPRAGVRQIRASRLARVLPECRDAQRARRGAKLQPGCTIPENSSFDWLLGDSMIWPQAISPGTVASVKEVAKIRLAGFQILSSAAAAARISTPADP